MHFQTAECLVVGELATKDMIVVLNKVDQLPEEGRSKVITKAKKRLKQTLGSTKFAGCAMVPTAVKPGQSCFIIRVQLQCLCQHCSYRLIGCSSQSSTLGLQGINKPEQERYGLCFSMRQMCHAHV